MSLFSTAGGARGERMGRRWGRRRTSGCGSGSSLWLRVKGMLLILIFDGDVLLEMIENQLKY
jgi:hypothetical protein